MNQDSVLHLFYKFATMPSRVAREGVVSYLRERHRLGPHRYHLRRWLLRGRLSRNSATFRGHKLQIPASSRAGIVEDLLIFGDHEPLARETYEAQLRPGDNVLEVGTNIGFYLLVESLQLGDKGEIVGFEPDPDLFETALENAASLSTPCTVHNMAAGESRGRAKFYRSEIPNWGTLYNTPLRDDRQPIEVDTISIDEFCEESGFAPNVLRMDIEGGELQVFPGARQTLKTHRPTVFVELHPTIFGWEKMPAILEVLTDAGYQDYTVINRCTDWPWVKPERRREDLSRCNSRQLSEMVRERRPAGVFSVIANRDGP